MSDTWIKRILGHPFIWRASGVSFPLAVLATRGAVQTASDYLRQSKLQMDRLPIDWTGQSVYEFGCGLGGNLLAISDDIRSGFGIDVNRGYIQIASELARRLGARNIGFQTYNGFDLPRPSEVDWVLSLGVFERLTKSLTARYVSGLAKLGEQDMRMALYFLSNRARDTPFVRRLGTTAYSFWDRSELKSIFHLSGLSVEQFIPWPSESAPIAEVCIIRRAF